MANWAEKTRQNLMKSDLREPTTKVGKLRAILPELEAVLGGGRSQAECMEWLKRTGLTFPSLTAFRMALSDARKAGPLYPTIPVAAAGVAGGSTMGLAVPHSSDVQSVSNRTEQSNEPMPEYIGESRTVVRKDDGVLKTRTVTGDKVTNATPSLDDLI
jgi:hypothetical protein